MVEHIPKKLKVKVSSSQFKDMKFFNKKKTSESEASSTTTSSSTQPPSYSADPTALNENRDLENAESDKKKGKLPAYETEQDHYLGKLMDNYGSGGLGGGFGAPKLPNIPPRQKKPKKK